MSKKAEKETVKPEEERAYIRSRINQANKEALERPGKESDTPGDPHGVSWVGHRSLEVADDKKASEEVADVATVTEKIEGQAEAAVEAEESETEGSPKRGRPRKS